MQLRFFVDFRCAGIRLHTWHLKYEHGRETLLRMDFVHISYIRMVYNKIVIGNMNIENRSAINFISADVRKF